MRSDNPVIRHLLQDQIPHIARSEYPVLIRGEVGTGKEALARHLHSLSRRAERPFVKVDCSTLPEGLWELELFGHSPSGGRAPQPGRLQRAHGGTLYLDEVAVVPWEVQGHVLRLLEDKQVQPVGGADPVPVDARLVAASSRNLPELVAQGRFRSDLYYRLSVLVVTLPPLRERMEDLPRLAREMLERHAPEAGYDRVPELSAGAKAALLSHTWPGNIRELENALKRALVLAAGRVIQAEHLGLEGDPALGEGGTDLWRRFKAATEKAVILWALRDSGYDRSKAARLLGISRAALYKKLGQWGLITPEEAADVARQAGEAEAEP